MRRNIMTFIAFYLEEEKNDRLFEVLKWGFRMIVSVVRKKKNTTLEV